MKITNISPKVFVCSASQFGGDAARADLVSSGRLLMAENAYRSMSGKYMKLNAMTYGELNGNFAKKRAMYAAKIASEITHTAPPENYDFFRRNSIRYFRNSDFLHVLQGLDQEIIYPVIAATYTDAVEDFADVSNVGIGETKTIDVGSNDIPFFADSSWGASRAVPENRLYNKTFTMNPTPKTAQTAVKWSQFVGNDMDFGQYYTSMTAGLYSKTVAMWSEVLLKASKDTSLIPEGLTFTYSTENFVKLINKLSALNNVNTNGLICFGSLVPLAKMLPKDVSSGSSAANIDAALTMLLGKEYMDNGYIDNQYGVRVKPMRDAIVPGTQNTNPKTVLPEDRVWIMSARGRRPLQIAMNTETPITLEYDPRETSNMMMGINITTAIDIVATVSDKIGTIYPI